MVGKNSYETSRFSYKQVESALAAVFGLDAKTMAGPLRGRLKRLQTLGLPAEKPGKGARIEYSFEQAMQWLIALKMSDLGMDPAVIAKAIHDYWDTSIAPGLRAGLPGRLPLYLVLRPQLMRDSWLPRKRPWIDVADVPNLISRTRYDEASSKWVEIPFDDKETYPRERFIIKEKDGHSVIEGHRVFDPPIFTMPSALLMDSTGPADTIPVRQSAIQIDTDPGEWFCTIDISHLLRALQKALEERTQ
jgi:hypothetical protein